MGFINNNCNLRDFEVDGTPFDQVGLDPGLVEGPGGEPVLTDNGGPTKTHALLPGSPAIDKAYSCRAEFFGGFLVSFDQRGAIRPGGRACDVGAYELGTPKPITTRLEINPVMGTYNRATKQFTQQVTLKNPITGSRITGQVFLVLDNLNLTLVNKDGNSVNVDPKFPRSPYLIVNIGANHVLAPGEEVSVTLIFNDPLAQPPRYTARVLAGAGVP